MKRLLYVWCTVMFVIFSIGGANVLYAQTKTSYQVNLLYVPGWVDAIDEGPGVQLNKDILNRIERREGVTFKVSFFPAKRGISLFNDGEADLIFSTVLGTEGDDPSRYQSQATIDSAPLVGSGYIIITLTSLPKLSALSDLEGKVVGVVRGNILPPSLSRIPVKAIEEVNSTEQNFLKLKAGRIDAILLFEALALTEMKRLNVSGVHYGQAFEHIFACYSAHLSPEGARLIEYINRAFGEMLKDGTYQALFKDDPNNLLLP